MAALEAMDLDAVMDNYTADAKIVRFTGIVHSGLECSFFHSYFFLPFLYYVLLGYAGLNPRTHIPVCGGALFPLSGLPHDLDWCTA